MQGTPPTTSSDITFLGGTTYAPTTFNVNSGANLSIGTVNNLDATQTLTISNTTANTTSIITFNGGINSVAPTNGGNAADLLFVASGGALTINGNSGAAGTGQYLGLNLVGSGNIDTSGTATINTIITGTGSLTKTGSGTLVINNSVTTTGTAASGSTTLTIANASSLFTVGQSVGGTGLSSNSSIAAISGNTITLSATTTAAIAGGTITIGGNTYSGGTTLTSGTVILNNGIPGIVNSGSTATLSGVFGTGNLTIGGGVTIAANSQANQIAAPLINIVGDFTLGTASSVQRIAMDGTFDMGGATRVVTLNKTNAGVASGNEILSIGTRAGTGFQPIFQNGTIDFEAGPLASGTAPATVLDITTTMFPNNSGLIIGPNVVFGANVFSSGTNAPKLTVNGSFYAGIGTTSRSTEVFSLSGSGMYTNAVTNGGISTLTVSGSSGTARRFQV